MAMSAEHYRHWQKVAKDYLDRIGIVLTPEESARIEVADFGLDDFERIGLMVFTYINTSRVCAKELVMLPGQTCPQHLHPPVEGQPGKEETFRCRWGEVYLYVPGASTLNPKAVLPKGREHTYNVGNEITLHPGEQYTLYPEIWHWFQAGPDGVVVSEFSTHSTDANDIFVDKDIRRLPVIED